MIKHLFSTPIFEQVVVGDLHLAMLEEATAKSDTPLLDRQSASMIRIRDTLRFYLTQYAIKVGLPDVDFSRGWINRVAPGDISPLHSHGTSLIALVWYLDVTSDSGDLLLLDPRPAAGLMWPTRSVPKFTGLTTYPIQPAPGKLVLFPGFLQHMTDVNRSNRDRVSFACNVKRSTG